jgi:hypothetical protein
MACGSLSLDFGSTLAHRIAGVKNLRVFLFAHRRGGAVFLQGEILSEMPSSPGQPPGRELESTSRK